MIRLLSKSLIRLRIHKRIDLRSIGDLDLSQPALLLRALVDGTGLVLQHAVRFDDLAADGGHDVGRALDGLNGADGVAGVDFQVDGGELNVDDVAEGFGCVGGDADGSWREGVC